MVPRRTPRTLTHSTSTGSNLLLALVTVACSVRLTSAVLAISSMEDEDGSSCSSFSGESETYGSAQGETCSNSDWFDIATDVTPQELGWALLLVSSIRRMNDTVHFWVVPLYTFSVFGYLIAIYVQRFQRKWKLHRLERRKAKRKKAKKSGVTVTPTLVKPPAPSGMVKEEESKEEQPIDLTGTFKLVKIENLDAFLAAQGVPWPLRKAASKVLPTHHITHQQNNLTIRIDAGPIQTQTTYRINGGKVETVVRGRLFEDRVGYLQDETTGSVCGILTEKTAVTEGYRVTVSRRLSEDLNTIYMESIASFPNDPAKETIVSTQQFERVDVTQ